MVVPEVGFNVRLLAPVGFRLAMGSAGSNDFFSSITGLC